MRDLLKTPFFRDSKEFIFHPLTLLIKCNTLNSIQKKQGLQAMKETFEWTQSTIDNSTIADNEVIAVDEIGLVAGGWFVDPSKYPNAVPVATAKEVKERAQLVDGKYRIELDMPSNYVKFMPSQIDLSPEGWA